MVGRDLEFYVTLVLTAKKPLGCAGQEQHRRRHHCALVPSCAMRLFSDNARVVKIGTHRYPIQRSHKGHLRQVDFLFDGHDMRGIEQNPSSNNRWAALVRSGKKVAQFISNGRYIASVVDGKLTRFS